MNGLRLELYVSGGDAGAESAVEHARRLIQGQPPEAAQLDVIDARAEPERAERAECLVTPTLVRTRPAPERRVTGDLSDLRAVREALGLVASAGQRSGA